MIAGVLLVWWLIGVVLFLHVCWLIIPEITIGDLCVAALAGVAGPVMVIGYCYLHEGIMRTVVFRKRS